jgi:hypothetical protein
MGYRLSLLISAIVVTGGVASAQTLDLADQTIGLSVSRATVDAGNSSADDEWAEDPNRTRLLLGTNARSLHRGEFYLDIIGINVLTVEAGVTDRLTLGAGTPILFPGTRPLDLYWLTPKLQIYSGKKTTAALGVIHGVFGDAKLGVAYGAVTHGSSHGAVSAGLGYAYAHGDGAGGAVPVVQFGADRRVSPVVTLLTENYFARGLTMVSGGIRFIRHRRTLDLGVFVHTQSKNKAPMIRWTMAFGSGADRLR